MKKRKWSRKVAWIFGVTAVCTLGLVLLKTGHVFGKYSEESTYLQYTGDTDSDPVKVMDSNDVFVTDEGGNKKGSQGTLSLIHILKRWRMFYPLRRAGHWIQRQPDPITNPILPKK